MQVWTYMQAEQEPMSLRPLCMCTARVIVCSAMCGFFFFFRGRGPNTEFWNRGTEKISVLAGTCLNQHCTISDYSRNFSMRVRTDLVLLFQLGRIVALGGLGECSSRKSFKLRWQIPQVHWKSTGSCVTRFGFSNQAQVQLNRIADPPDPPLE